MKEILFTLLIFGAISENHLCKGQSMLNIEVDSIHCQDSLCYLLNISDNDIFNCSIYTAYLDDIRVNHILDCERDRSIEDGRQKNNILELKKIKSLDSFKTWISTMSFSASYKLYGDTYKYRYKSINESYGVSLTEFSDFDDNYSRDDYKVYQIVPIHVNQEYFIAGLIESGYNDIELFIFPDEHNQGLMHYYKSILFYSQTTLEYDTDRIEKAIFETYYIQDRKSKMTLTNTFSSHPILEGSYDQIVLEFPFIITKSNSDVNIYNYKLEEITPSNLFEAYAVKGSLQLIIDGKLSWLNPNGSLTDSMIINDNYSFCSKSMCIKKSIVYHNKTFIETLESCNQMLPGPGMLPDSTVFDINRDILDIKYLNGKHQKTFYQDCNDEIFCHHINLYYFETRSNTRGIFRRVNEKQEKIDAIWANKSIPYNQQLEQVIAIRNNSKITYRDEIIWEGNFAEVLLLGYNTPVIFKEDGKYGAYPIMKKAKYKLVKKYNAHLAEVIFDNDEKGWIDLEGKEIIIYDK